MKTKDKKQFHHDSEKLIANWFLILFAQVCGISMMANVWMQLAVFFIVTFGCHIEVEATDIGSEFC